MICAWKELLSILPGWIKQGLRSEDILTLRELRLRIHSPPEFVMGGKLRWLPGKVEKADLDHVVNTASRYSPWSAASVSSGYLTAPGGHRIGLCGEVICREGQVTGIRPGSLCIRVAKDYPGIAAEIAKFSGSVLILGAPNWGKTTLLRDLIRQRSEKNEHITVIDSRAELYPSDIFQRGKCTDVLTGCPREKGIEMALRTMGPGAIAMDEITSEEDCQALIRAAWCGVKLIATAHAASYEDFCRRNIYRPLISGGIFDHIVMLHSDQSWHLERSAG